MPRSEAHKASDTPRRRFAPFAITLLILSAIAAAFIDFPPGDSWTHGWTVQQWLHGNWVLNDWSSAVALPQQALGWLVHAGTTDVSWPRLSVLTALVTVAGCLLAARLPSRLYPDSPHLKDWAPLFAVVCLATPFGLKVAAGFMTDGYYLFLLTAALWVLLAAVSDPGKQTNAQWIVRWTGFAALGTLATLQRTHGLVLLVVVGVWMLFTRLLYPANDIKGGPSGMRDWRAWYAVGTCALGVVLSLIVLELPELHPARSGEVTTEVQRFWEGYRQGLEVSPKEIVDDRTMIVFGILQHLGFALLPVALIARLQRTAEEKARRKRRVNWWYVLGGAAFLLFTFKLWGVNGELFPYLGNSITPEGFGERARTIALTAGHEMDTRVRVLLTAFGTGGGIVLVWILSRTVRLEGVSWRAPSTLIGILGFAHLVLLLLNPHFFDRYLFPLLPFCLCWLAPLLKDAPAKARLGAWILALAFLVWTVQGVADSLDWSKAKWDLAAECRSRGIQSDRLVAGYEPDGFYNYSNEDQAGPEDIYHSTLPWWVTQLGLPIRPAYVIFEEGSQPEGTVWARYVPTEFANDRMRAWVAPELIDPVNNQHQ